MVPTAVSHCPKRLPPKRERKKTETEEHTNNFIRAIKVKKPTLCRIPAAKTRRRKPHTGGGNTEKKKVTFNTRSSKITYNPQQTKDHKKQRAEEVDTIFERKQTSLKRIYTYENQTTLLAKHDNEVQGTCLTNRLGKIAWIEAKYAYNRQCGCKECLKQLPKCRQLPCKQCTKL